jgi:hypothetical protein
VFLPSRGGFWFSSSGEFPWSYLGPQKDKWADIRVGYFDDDARCDVLAESDGRWVISSGARGPWTSIGSFDAPLNEVAFGRFDPEVRDGRPNATRRTTHAFRRAPDGQWLVTSLAAPNWQAVQHDPLTMDKLRFGDFTGDGVTDVLAVVDGKWAISESARGEWANLNPQLSNGVKSLFIADLNGNNIDDLIRMDWDLTGSFPLRAKVTWWVSDDGRSPWRKIKTHDFEAKGGAQAIAGLFGLAGRFGALGRGAVLAADFNRTGHFFSEAEGNAGSNPDWKSLFDY